MKRITFFIPFILIIILSIVLWRALSLNPQELDSVLEGRAVPAFKLSSLHKPERLFTQKDLIGQVTLLNIWATWCPACKQEHPYLMQLAQNKDLPLIGINYRDPKREKSIKELEQFGNPFQKVIYDPKGQLGLDLGVYGAPETYVIDHLGIIRMRHAGIINDRVWKSKIEPLVQQLQQEALVH
tara:strand:+ start:6466 stop:7014 length:549 start_codon:yes stop_codon:yes gene_type:complete